MQNDVQKRNSLKKGKVAWQSPSNIALIKYWGKKGFQIPANASFSLTLSASCTVTEISYAPSGNPGIVNLDFYFEESENSAFAARIEKYLLSISRDFSFVLQMDFTIKSRNTFPHSAGIASSASAMSALALCLCSIEADLSGNPDVVDDAFLQRASHFARIGSGSASRSVYGKWAGWGLTSFIPQSSDFFARPYVLPVHELFAGMNDAILIVSNGEKKVSSRVGHELMDGNPYAEVRYAQADKNMEKLLLAMRNGDMDGFIEVVENEALSLHGMMMASNPGFVLLEQNTLRIIEKIRSFREQTKCKLCFTLDAGPNVHLLYPAIEKQRVVKFIDEDLKSLCENERVIFDLMGQGPKKISLDE